MCALGNNEGTHKCVHSTPRLPESEWRWCGSNWDALGNPRFKAADPASAGAEEGLESDHGGAKIKSTERLMGVGVYEEGMNWGLITFDSFPKAFVTIFQIITLEGWTSVM